MLLNQIRINIANFLNITLIDKPYIYLNFWSFLHMSSGFLIMAILNKNEKIKLYEKYIITFILLVLWELFELSFTSNGSNLFLLEKRKDIFFDLVMGMAGAFIKNINFKWGESNKDRII